jgi:exonuclease III
MKLLSWNCRGLGKPDAVRALRQLTKAHHPDIVFLIETKLQSSELSAKTNSFGNCFSNTFSGIVLCLIIIGVVVWLYAGLMM